MIKKIGLAALLFFSITSANSQEITSNLLIDNQGFSVTSLWRGVLGMAALLLIAFLYSKDRKSINWKTTFWREE